METIKTKKLLDYQEYKEFHLHGAEIQVVTNVGKPLRDKNGNKVKDEDGKVQYIWKKDLKYTVSFSDCTLADVIHLATDKIVRSVATLRDSENGQEKLESLNGKRVSAKAYISGTLRQPKEIKALRRIEKLDLNKEEKQALIKELQKSLES